MPITRFAVDGTTTDLPVNCLLRLPLPVAASSTTNDGKASCSSVSCLMGAYGPLPDFGGKGERAAGRREVVMMGCYKHDAATETYSGAVRVSAVVRSPTEGVETSPSPTFNFEAEANNKEKHAESDTVPPYARQQLFSSSSASATSSASSEPFSTILCDVPLPDYGVFDLTLVGTVSISGGVEGEVSSNFINMAPHAAEARLFPQSFISALSKRLESEMADVAASSSSSSVVYIVAAPCTDGHLRLFGIVVLCETRESSSTFSPLSSTCFVIADVPVAEPMLTSVAFFPLPATTASPTTFRAICASHGGEMHLITARLAVEEEKASNGLGLASASLEQRLKTPLATFASASSSSSSSSDSSPSYTHFAWEGHEYDSWCVSRDPLEPFNAFWSGGDDGKLKRWVMTSEKWGILESNAEGFCFDEDEGEEKTAKPALGFSTTFDAGVVTIAPLFVHSALLNEKKDGEAGLSFFTSCYLIVGSYDENLRIYHLSNAVSSVMAAEASLSSRSPLISVWKRLMATPLMEVPCEGGAWRCRVAPPHTFLADHHYQHDSEPSAESSSSLWSVRIAAHHCEHTNVQECHIFVNDEGSSNDTSGFSPSSDVAPLFVAAMQRGGVIIFSPLPRYHRLQLRALTGLGEDGEGGERVSVSSALPLNEELVDEFTVNTDEDVVFLEKMARPTVEGGEGEGDEGGAAKTKVTEPLIYDICPIGKGLVTRPSAVTTDAPVTKAICFGVESILACSFYVKEVQCYSM